MSQDCRQHNRTDQAKHGHAKDNNEGQDRATEDIASRASHRGGEPGGGSIPDSPGAACPRFLRRNIRDRPGGILPSGRWRHRNCGFLGHILGGTAARHGGRILRATRALGVFPALSKTYRWAERGDPTRNRLRTIQKKILEKSVG